MRVPVIDLGRAAYAPAYERQVREAERVLASRESTQPSRGVILLVEHDPVITISNRPGAQEHLLATAAQLAAAGVGVAPTDRGGDITYHGPGQLVAYPILDLNALGLGLHAYMRLLEHAVIDTLAAFGVSGQREDGNTGVWVPRDDGTTAKIAAMGVRVRRWVSMHGLALNVRTDLRHFDLIVPCGLAGRAVTSLEALLGPAGPDMAQVKDVLVRRLQDQIAAAAERRKHTEPGAGPGSES